MLIKYKKKMKICSIVCSLYSLCANFAYLNYNTVYNIKYINDSMEDIIKELSKPWVTFTEIKTKRILEYSPVILLKDNKILLLTLGQILLLIDKDTFEAKATMNSDFHLKILEILLINPTCKQVKKFKYSNKNIYKNNNKNGIPLQESSIYNIIYQKERLLANNWILSS